MQSIVDYIKNPLQMGKKEEDTLALLIEKYPYFQSLHILLAKSQKNQHSFSFSKSLKSASLHAGDRKILYKFIEGKSEHAPEPEKVELNIEPTEPELNHNPVEETNIVETADKIEDEITISPIVEHIEVIEEDQAIEIEPEIVEATIETEIQDTVPIETPIEQEDDLMDQVESIFEMKDVTEEKIIHENYEPVPETIDLKSDIISAEEQDFFSWLDNFKIETPQPLNETLKTEHSPVKNVEIETKAALDQNIIEELETNDEPNVYDPAGWAEIAYDIQAFVKHKDPEPEEENTPKEQTKQEIDALLDRFIKKNPSISRTKTEFYKPENMARKSEEFHGEVASETLASLFYKQGHLHKSLELYEKLILQNPDKKEIFAARIKSIKEELINRL